MPRLQLSFHGTFAFKKEDILKILHTASEPTALDDSLENLMRRTGLGNQKVKPMISWASRAGLIKNKRLTSEGKFILQCDHYLESINTDWLMHFYLSFGDKGLQLPPEKIVDWGGWSYFIYTFLPQNQSFTTDELQNHSSLVFEQEQPQSLSKNFRIILRSYTESHALSACRFLIKKGQEYESGNALLPNPYLIGYFLAKLWERDYQKQGSILTQLILTQKMGLAPILGVNLEKLQEQLNTLEAYGIIEQRRTVSPFQIVPRWDDPLILLEKAYESDQ